MLYRERKNILFVFDNFLRLKMTLMSGGKYNENKWKNGYGSGGLDKPKTILTLRISALLVIAVVLIVLLKFLVVLSKYRLFI